MSKTNEDPITQTTAAKPSLLAQFQELGMFASPEAKPDKIELRPGVVAELFVLELPDVKFRKLWADNDRAKLIAATVCDADGKPVMTEKQAAQLKPNVAAQFQALALKHSGFGEDAKVEAEEAGND